MDPLRFLAETNGFFTRADAREFGYADKHVTAMKRSGHWHTFRRGTYTFSDLWNQMNEIQRHQVRSHAVLRSLGSAVALSHVSGAIEHGIASWGLPLDRVHVTRLDGGAGRVEGDVVHHEGFCLDSDVQEPGKHQVLAPDRCAIEAASWASNEVRLGHVRLALAPPSGDVRRVAGEVQADAVLAQDSSLAHPGPDGRRQV